MCKSFLKSLQESYLLMFFCPKQDTKLIYNEQDGETDVTFIIKDTTRHMTK